MHRFSTVTSFALLIALGLGQLHCATVINGSHQRVPLTSSPPNATVLVDGVEAGTTPITVKLRRRKPHIIEFKKEGFQTVEKSVVRTHSGWIWGNILIGGLVGLLVDLIAGSHYSLQPASIDAELRLIDAENKKHGDAT